MEYFVSYLMPSVVSILLLYLVFAIFLRGGTHFRVNRIFLAGTALFSLILPFIPSDIPAVSGDPVNSFLLETVTVTNTGMRNTIQSNPGFLNVVLTLYLAGAGFFALRFLFRISQMVRLILKGKIIRREELKIVVVPEHYTPFSFLGFVFLPSGMLCNDNLPKVLMHESVHVRQQHSLDILLLEILTIVQWFNPVAWILGRSLRAVHEYLADRRVVAGDTGDFTYQTLLISQTAGFSINNLASNFNHSILKKRIIMMTKERSGKFSGWKAIISVPVMAWLILAFSSPVKSGSVSFAGNNTPEPAISVLSDGNDTLSKKEDYEQLKTYPEFPGGTEALMGYMKSNIKYPEDAKKDKIQGKVFVSFLVDKQGRITKVELKRGVSPSLDQEALRVVTAMPAWKPGISKEGKPMNVMMVLPIQFSLEKEKK